MNKFLSLLYYFLIGIFVLFVVYLTVMLAISPKQDRQKRGFIACTEQLVLDVAECERGSVVCPLKYLGHDMACNTAVILDGFGAWLRGRQPTPWANYLFVAESPEVTDEDFDSSHIENMDELEQQRQFIQHKQQELDAAKNRSLNLRDDVLMSAPEEILPEDEKSAVTLPDDANAPTDDISEEAFTDDIKTVEQNTEEKKQDEEK